MNTTTIWLLVYSLLVTTFAVGSIYERSLTYKEFERTIFEQEKLVLEMSNRPTPVCEKPYTYDQWISDEPCPVGKDGPLCHMETP
jgi:hypothetical protein